jgi:hypothetical protein
MDGINRNEGMVPFLTLEIHKKLIFFKKKKKRDDYTYKKTTEMKSWIQNLIAQTFNSRQSAAQLLN